MTFYVASTIRGFEECVCTEIEKEFYNSSCSTLGPSLVVFSCDEPVDSRLHSISSLSILLGVLGIRDKSRRSIRLSIRDILYAMRDSGIVVKGVRVRVDDKGISRLVEVIVLREIRRVYGDGPKNGTYLWIMLYDNTMWFSIEVARRVYSKLWVSSAGLNPIVSFCLANSVVLETKPKRVLEVFAGTATMALESCRLGALYCIGLDIDPAKLLLSLRNAEKYGLTHYYDAVVGDASKLPFRNSVFEAILGDPPRGRRLIANIGFEEVAKELVRVANNGLLALIASPDIATGFLGVLGEDKVIKLEDIIVGSVKVKIMVLGLK